METSLDLFNNGDSSSPPTESITSWQFVTNQRNLLYMLAAGLIMPPKAFGKKYYQDTLSAFPGWIPLFANSVPQKAIENSISEKAHLIPCIASIDLSLINGRVMVAGPDGAMREALFPNELDGRERVLFIPAPLPVNLITSIGFRSRDEKTRCEQDARDFLNVPLSDFPRKVNSSIFNKSSGDAWPPEEAVLSSIETALDLPFSAGGMMAMLLHMANRGDIGINASRLAFDPEIHATELNSYPMISALGEWIATDHLTDSPDVAKSLFWGIIDKISECHSSNSPISPLDAALEHLQSSSDLLDDRKKQAGAKLAEDLRTLASFSDSTITEVFERHPKPLSRAMSLFALRERCTDLLEFKHPLLNEIDYVAAAILFSARDGWLGLPVELRDIPGLKEAVSHRMAAMAHRKAKTGINLGIAPPRPKSMRELFASVPNDWSKAQKEAAVFLAKECKWDCIQTRVSLGKGDYRLTIDSSGVHILLEGEAKAVITEVAQNKFFISLAQTPIPCKLDQKIRNLLKE